MISSMTPDEEQSAVGHWCPVVPERWMPLSAMDALYSDVLNEMSYLAVFPSDTVPSSLKTGTRHAMCVTFSPSSSNTALASLSLLASNV